MDFDNSLLLKKLTASWAKRAQVKKEELLPFFEDNREDFITTLLPFSHSPAYSCLSPEMKSKILTVGWLLYNFKTIQIESKVVMPSCVDIIKKGSSVIDNELLLIAAETMTDEAYHIYLMIKANQFTEQRRGIKLHPPMFNLIREKNKLQNLASEKWQKMLINLVFAIVSEVYIGDYLDTVSHSKEIQPFNQMLTMIHRNDEISHRRIFKEIAKHIFNTLSMQQKHYFAKIFPLPLKGFFDMELIAWENALKEIKCDQIKTLISDARSISQPKRDYSQIISLATEIGILGLDIGQHAFQAENIL